jgi:hypothetical protein
MPSTVRAAVLAVAALCSAACTASTSAPPAAANSQTSSAAGPVAPKPQTSARPAPAALRTLDRQAAVDDGAVPSAAPGGARPSTWFVGQVGTYLVGRGIPPGTYRSAAAPAGMCTWERLGGSTGATPRLIQQGTGGGAITVRIKATDRFFQTQGCANWHRVG